MSKLTVEDLLTSSGRYPERAKSSELTEELLNNAKITIERVNALLDEVGYTGKRDISSGFRPSQVNAGIKTAAKKSAHMLCMAVDLFQPKDNNEIAKLIRQHQGTKGKLGILGKHQLMMENPQYTVGIYSNWTHLDCIERTERPSMEFNP